MKLREWLLLISLLCLAPTAMAHDNVAPLDELTVSTKVINQSALQYDDGCIDCHDPANENCADTDCCSLCTAGISLLGLGTNTPTVTRDSAGNLESEEIVPTVLPPPFRPPIV